MTSSRRTAGAFRWVLTVVAGTVACSGAGAQSTPTFFFYTQGQTPTSAAQGLTSLAVTANADFTLSVWYSFQPPMATTYFGIDVFVGFDQTSSVGTSASPQNNTVGLGTGLDATTAITNVNPVFLDLSNELGGGQDPSDSPTPSSAIRPYGDDIDLAGVSGFSAPGSQPVHLFDVTLNDLALGNGGSQSIAIYSNDPVGNATDFTTYLDDGSGNPSAFARPTATYLLSAIQTNGGSATPEPSSLNLTLGALTLFAFGNLAFRRLGRRTEIGAD